MERQREIAIAASCLFNLWHGDEQEMGIENCVDDFNDAIRADVLRHLNDVGNDAAYVNANVVFIRHAFAPLSKPGRDALIAQTLESFKKDFGVNASFLANFQIPSIIALADKIMSTAGTPTVDELNLWQVLA